MSLLLSNEISIQLANELKKTKEEVQIISAFCKEQALLFVDSYLSPHVKEKKLLVRFTLSDIIFGASDMGIYELCKSKNWKMFIRFDLHAKTYIFDKKRCILGSANLTGKGMGLSKYPNHEISSLIDIERSDLIKIDSLFQNAIQLDDNLFQMMLEDLSEYNKKATGDAPSWRIAIQSQFNPNVSSLFTYELPSTLFNMSSLDTDFLDISENVTSKEEIRKIFTSSKAYSWIYTILSQQPNKEAYFGFLTEKLHNAVINDPKPYRKDIKILLSNLLNWIEVLDIKEISITRPNYSQCIKLIENK